MEKHYMLKLRKKQLDKTRFNKIHGWHDGTMLLANFQTGKNSTVGK